MNKLIIFLGVFAGFVCFSSGKQTEQTVNLKFDEGTSHFKAKHYSGPPTEPGTNEGEIATQIVGNVSMIWFVGGDKSALANQGKPGQGVTFTATVQHWSWRNGKWNKMGRQETMAKIPIKGKWEENGDFVNMTWDTGYGK